MTAVSSPVFSDFQALSGLRAEARQAPGQSLEKVASQFESLFVQMMLKAMRDATTKGELFNSSQMEFSQQMMDQQLSVELSQNGGLGLADVLVQQLSGGITPTQQTDAALQDVAANPLAVNRVPSSPLTTENNPVAFRVLAQKAGTPSAAPAQAPAKEEQQLDRMGVAKPWQPQTPEEFIKDVWDYAVAAAGDIGVKPEVLVAQSALETGWGKKVVKKSDGENSFNLFNIKAGSRWGGESASVKTLEFRDGVAEMERADFRAYDSLASSFKDYAEFLKTSPRYKDALTQADNNQGFLEGLQQAGYATDPQYAEKVQSVLSGSSFSSVIDKLKNSANLSLLN